MDTYIIKRYLVEFFEVEANNKIDAQRIIAKYGDPYKVRIDKETVVKQKDIKGKYKENIMNDYCTMDLQDKDTEYLSTSQKPNYSTKIICDKSCSNTEKELDRLRGLLIRLYKSYYGWQRHVVDRKDLK